MFLRKQIPLLVGLCLLLTGAMGFLGCDDGGDWEDDHVLNPNLIGTWSQTFPYEYEGQQYSSTETYIITDANKMSYPGDYSSFQDAEIVFVYNFNESKTMGGIIIKRVETTYQDKPYIAIWFNDVKPKESVAFGTAYDTTKDYTKGEDTDASVATLAAAKERFKYENATTYGGGSGNIGAPLLWVANP